MPPNWLKRWPGNTTPTCCITVAKTPNELKVKCNTNKENRNCISKSSFGEARHVSRKWFPTTYFPKASSTFLHTSTLMESRWNMSKNGRNLSWNKMLYMQWESQDQMAVPMTFTQNRSKCSDNSHSKHNTTTLHLILGSPVKPHRGSRSSKVVWNDRAQ